MDEKKKDVNYEKFIEKEKKRKKSIVNIDHITLKSCKHTQKKGGSCIQHLDKMCQRGDYN
jgi:hypothetical protein